MVFEVFEGLKQQLMLERKIASSRCGHVMKYNYEKKKKEKEKKKTSIGGKLRRLGA